MKRKLLAVFASLLLLCTMLPLGAVGVSAATYGDYTYTVSNGEVTITDCNEAASGAKTVPSTINGYPVKKLGDFAFYNCDSLTSVTLPDSITRLGEYVFESCEKLTSVHLGSGITVIPYATFQYCYNLTSVNIPSGVTTISEYAFCQCTSLTSITIPASVATIKRDAFVRCKSLSSLTLSGNVTMIGENAFGGCTALTSINVSSSNPNYCSQDGILFNKDKTMLMQYPAGRTGEYTIPDSVDAIALYAFYECGLTSVVIPEGVSDISSGAFYNCTALTSVTIPASVTTVGYQAFYQCNKVASVHISDLTAWCNLIFNANNYILGNLYLNGELATEIVIPDGVATISDYAFYRRSALASVSIPDSVTAIGDYAFSACYSLTSVTVPDGVQTIGDYAFSSCESLASVTIPDSVATIGIGAFYGCWNVSSIPLPDTAISIGSDAFVGTACYDNPDNWDNGVLYIGKHLIVAKSWYCSGDYVVREGTLTIADRAFYNCTAVKTVLIADSVILIGESTFFGCRSLAWIEIPDSVTAIGNSAFSGCTTLASVEIGNGVTSIAQNAFANTKYFNNTQNWEDGVLYSGQYLIAANTSLRDEYAIKEGTTLVADGAFYYCDDITAIVIPDSVIAIGDYAFYNCYNLISATIPDSVTAIGDYAFYRCSSLTSVTIPDSVTAIGDYAFCNCYNLISVTIPDSVTAVGDYVFYNCYNLISVTIPDSVTAIGDYAFSACNALTDVYYGGSEADRENMAIGSKNDAFLNATWHYTDNPISTTVGHSVMDTERGNGLAFRFELAANGVATKNVNTVDLTSATINYLGEDCKLIGMGAMLTNQTSVGSSQFTLEDVNGITVLDIPTVYMQEVTDTSCAFATRLINIPDTAMDWMIYARPYYIVEVEGEEIVVYGDVDSASCVQYM